MGIRTARHRDLADLLLCLSRAFLPPPIGLSFRDWGDALAQDLAELGDSLGLDVDAAVHALSAPLAEADAGAAPEGWLVPYSGLFLTPPVAVALNTGLYLEGSLGGESGQMMRSCYELGGVLPNAAFRDLPDHVAMQLEFLGRMHERASHGEEEAADLADDFFRGFVQGWAGPLERACRAAAGERPAARVFAELAAVVVQLAQDGRRPGR